MKNKDGPSKDTYGPYVNYAISKCSNVLFARELQRRYGDKGVTAVSAHPGVIETGLFDPNSLPINKNWFKLIGYFLDPVFNLVEVKDISQGAATTLRCVSMSDSEIKGGHYYVNCQDGQETGWLTEAGKLREYEDYEKESKEARLWALTETLITEKGFALEL